MADPIDRLGRSVAVVGAMIAATVSLTSVVSSCEKQRTDQYSLFRTAVQAEDAHWKALYDDYLSTFSPDYAANPDRRRAKIVALFTIASRKLPSFVEHQVDEAEKTEALSRLSAMQTGLLNSLDQQGLTDPDLGRRLGQLSFAGKLSIAPPNATPAAGGSDPAPVRREVVELTPVSATGWDLDLFWCDGSGAEANYRLALSVGESLAVPALAGRSIAPGVTLGRIRVRPAPDNLTKGSGPARATWIVADSSEGEQQAAIALQKSINTALRRDVFGLALSDGKPTRWYLSGFVCPPTSAPAAVNPS